MRKLELDPLESHQQLGGLCGFFFQDEKRVETH